MVSDGFETGAGVFESGEVCLGAGDYTLELSAFTFGPAGPLPPSLVMLSVGRRVSKEKAPASGM